MKLVGQTALLLFLCQPSTVTHTHTHNNDDTYNIACMPHPPHSSEVVLGGGEMVGWLSLDEKEGVRMKRVCVQVVR